MSSTAATIPFAGATLGSYRHVCAFFSSPEDEYETMLPFVRDGLERGERAYHLVSSDDIENHLERLRTGGVDVAEARRTGQLEVATPREYMRGGHIDQATMLVRIREVLEAGTALGFPLTRFVGHTRVVWENPDLVHEWIEYEARLNDVLPACEDPVICTYDTRILSGSLAIEVLRTHPVAVIGGLLFTNPFLVPPQEFLRQFAHQPALAGDHA